MLEYTLVPCDPNSFSTRFAVWVEHFYFSLSLHDVHSLQHSSQLSSNRARRTTEKQRLCVIKFPISGRFSLNSCKLCNFRVENVLSQKHKHIKVAKWVKFPWSRTQENVKKVNLNFLHEIHLSGSATQQFLHLGASSPLSATFNNVEVFCCSTIFLLNMKENIYNKLKRI